MSALTIRMNPLLLPRILIWSVLAGIISFTASDPDLWGNVRLGLDMIELRGFPAADPYSFTSDRPWTNHEWLAEVVMAAAYSAAGPPGLSVLKFVLLMGTFGLVLSELGSRRVPPMVQDVLVVLCVIGCVALTKSIRPQTFSVLLFASLLIIVRRVEDGRVRLLWCLPPLMLVWANLHGGWLVGLGILGLWTGIRVLSPMGASRAVWAAAGLATLAATLVNPHGIGIWQFLWETVGLGRADITEWQPLTGLPIVDSLPWVITTAVAALALVRATERRVTHLAVVLLLMCVSFRVMRVVPFYALAVALLLGPHVVRKPERPPKPIPPTPPFALAVVGLMALVFVGASLIASYRNATCIWITDDDWMADQQAAGYIREAGLNGRMLTWFDWGHYAIWFLSPQIRVSMDGRRETVYSDETTRQHLAIYYAWPGWENDLRRLDPDHIWLPSTLPVVASIEPLGWRRIVQTPRSAVFSRTAPEIASRGMRTPETCFPGEP